MISKKNFVAFFVLLFLLIPSALALEPSGGYLIKWKLSDCTGTTPYPGFGFITEKPVYLNYSAQLSSYNRQVNNATTDAFNRHESVSTYMVADPSAQEGLLRTSDKFIGSFSIIIKEKLFGPNPEDGGGDLIHWSDVTWKLDPGSIRLEKKSDEIWDVYFSGNFSLVQTYVRSAFNTDVTENSISWKCTGTASYIGDDQVSAPSDLSKSGGIGGIEYNNIKKKLPADADDVEIMELMKKISSAIELKSRMIRLEHDMAKSAIQNIRN